MKIFRALGFGLVIVILQELMFEVFSAFEQTLLAFFDITQKVLGSIPI